MLPLNHHTMIYDEKKFDLPAIEGISKASVDAHLGLYAGYVKNFNAIQALLENLMVDSETNAHALSELVRRASFEFDGMRLHEYYFAQWEQMAITPSTSSALYTALTKQFGTFENWQVRFKNIGMMRGPGWAILYFDPTTHTFHNAWVGEQHQGHFATLPIILALDVWEHAFIADYGTGGRSAYIDAFFKNLNWGVVEKRFADIS